MSLSRTGVTSKVDLLGLTSSGYPSGTNFGDIQNLLEPASRVSYLRIGVTSKVDRFGLTSSGYPSGTNFGDTPRLGRSLKTTRSLSQALPEVTRVTRSSLRRGCMSWLRESQVVNLGRNQHFIEKSVTVTRLCKMTNSDS